MKTASEQAKKSKQQQQQRQQQQHVVSLIKLIDKVIHVVTKQQETKQTKSSAFTYLTQTFNACNVPTTIITTTVLLPLWKDDFDKSLLCYIIIDVSSYNNITYSHYFANRYGSASWEERLQLLQANHFT